MAKQQKLKLYFHHGRYMAVEPEGKPKAFRPFLKLLNFFYNLFFVVGLSILKIFRLMQADVLRTKQSLPKRLKVVFEAHYLRTILLFFVVAGLGWAALGSLNLIASGLELKSKIMGSAFLGKSYLSKAQEALLEQDFGQAQNRFALAFKAFNISHSEIEESGEVLNTLLNLVPQKRDADRLLKAAGLVAKAGAQSSLLAQNTASLKFGATGLNLGKGEAKATFESLEKGISEILRNLQSARALVEDVDTNNLPNEHRREFLDLKDKLYIAEFSLNNFNEVFGLAKDLIIGQKTVLLLLQNNNELRAAGGFIGTFGSIKTEDGKINSLNVSSVYDLDGQLLEKIRPPRPMLNVNDRWFLRDANWFADFPTSAQKISSFYEMEGGETPDLIVALTPSIVVNWLEIVGPIAMPKYDVVLNSENFIEQTQVITTLSNELPTNSPKQILADLFPILMQRLSEADPSSWAQIIQSLQNNLDQKQVVMYAKNPELQKKLEGFHWTGSMAKADRDFLSVVSSNLGGTKSDLYVDQKVRLTTNIDDEGAIINELEITRTNKLPDLEKTHNTSFVRIYAPSGSRLLSNIGFDYKNLQYSEGDNYKIDDDVLEWEKNSVTDNLTGTVIGKETGKTFFGNWIELKGGESKTVKLVYELPFKLKDVDRYSLLLQKQIGSISSDFSWKLNFSGRQIEWKNFDTETLDTSSLASDFILNKDYFLGLVLVKK